MVEVANVLNCVCNIEYVIEMISAFNLSHLRMRHNSAVATGTSALSKYSS